MTLTDATIRALAGTATGHHAIHLADAEDPERRVGDVRVFDGADEIGEVGEVIRALALEVQSLKENHAQAARERDTTLVVIADVARERDAALADLRELEWPGDEEEGKHVCPLCPAEHGDAHHVDCRLGTALRVQTETGEQR
jgi:hypothetical protein